MSVTAIDGTKDPLWTFLSVAFGWIAHADIHTEYLRYSAVYVFDTDGLVPYVSS
jgi:hypothetical protein